MSRFAREDRVVAQAGARDPIGCSHVEHINRAGESAESMLAAGAVKRQPIVLRGESARISHLDPVQESDIGYYVFDARQDEGDVIGAVAQHARRHVRLDRVWPLSVPRKLAQQLIVQQDAISVIDCWWALRCCPTHRSSNAREQQRLL